MPKAYWRQRTFPALAALILATVLSLVYFVSTQRSSYSPATINSTAIPPVSNPISPEKPADTTADTNQAAPPPAVEANGAALTTKEETKRETTKASAALPAKKVTVKTSTTQAKPAEEPKKEESKVGSILKKTGRILKKPFKF